MLTGVTFRPLITSARGRRVHTLCVAPVEQESDEGPRAKHIGAGLAIAHAMSAPREFHLLPLACRPAASRTGCKGDGKACSSAKDRIESSST